LDVISASVGGEQTCLLKSSGFLMCTGYDGYGGLGNGVFTPSALEPVLVIGLTAPAKQIVTGGSHSCALLSAPSDGAVMCWGFDRYGQLGDGNFTNSAIPHNVVNFGVGSTKFIASSRRNTCLISASGGVYCAGYDYYLGRCGVNVNSNVMVQIPGLISGYETVAMGAYHACALSTSGSLIICWGYGGQGMLGNGLDSQICNVPTTVTVLPINSIVTQLALGDYYTCTLLSTTQTMCFGYDTYGQMGQGTY
jgi:alpha-tubulin suppressor-like RCC1 family protein